MLSTRRVMPGVRWLRGAGLVNIASPEIYCDVFDRLEHDDVRYAVISGVAVVLHGHVRPVADLDIVINPAPEESARALRALAGTGFVPSLPLPLSMLSVLRMFDHTHREVDVFVRYAIPFDELWAGSGRRRVGHSVVRVISLEHLLRAKRINGRPHDLLDISGLLALKADRGAGKESA
jgi:hypothetical protein